MNLLRWIGVIPASIVGMYVCYLFSMLAGYLNFGWGVTINGETINIVRLLTVLPCLPLISFLRYLPACLHRRSGMPVLD